MPNINHRIVIDAAVAAIYPLVSTALGFTQWWAQDVTENGGEVDLGFFKKTTLYRLKLSKSGERAVEWRCLSGYEWEGTRLLFELTPDKNSTIVRFTHADWMAETDYFISCTTTWGELMFRLKAAAEGKPRGPLFLADGMGY